MTKSCLSSGKSAIEDNQHAEENSITRTSTIMGAIPSKESSLLERGFRRYRHFATRGRITHRLMRLERNGRRASLFAFGLRLKIPLRSIHQKNARNMTLANWLLLYQPRGAFPACPIAALTP